MPYGSIKVDAIVGQTKTVSVAEIATNTDLASYLTTSNAASTYAPLDSPTFTGSVTIPEGASISGYLTSALAASTYQTQAGMSNYVPTSAVGATIQPYDAATAKLDVAQTFTAVQTFPAAQTYPKIPANIQSSAYTLAASDAGKHVNISAGGITIPPNTFTAGDAISIYNNSSSDQSIIPGASVTLRQAGTANTGTRTISQYGLATILCISTNVFVIAGAGVA